MRQEWDDIADQIRAEQGEAVSRYDAIVALLTGNVDEAEAAVGGDPSIQAAVAANKAGDPAAVASATADALVVQAGQIWLNLLRSSALTAQAPAKLNVAIKELE